MARIGIFGGSFNPVHNGHVHLAVSAVRELGLSKLILVPSNIPPHKSASELCSNEIRYQMCCLAAEEICGSEVSRFEIDREGKSYSVYTAEYFRKMYPDDELFMLVGSDMFLSFDTWFRFEDILKNVSLAVVSREKDDMQMLEEKERTLSQYGNISVVRVPSYPVSSTQIRAMIRTDEKYSCYLPEKVVQYIRINNLYR